MNFSPDSAYIEEEFKTDHGNTFHIASNVDTAMTELKNDIEQTWNSKINHLEQMKTDFRNLSFFEKLNWQLKHKKINFDSTAEDRKKMINESAKFSKNVSWFTTLVSNKDNLKPLIKLLDKLNVKDVKILEMSQGQKISRVLAWKFQ